MVKGTRRHLSSVQTNEFENNIKMYAHLLEDEEMLLNIRNIGFVEKEVHYHAICRSRYQRKAEASATTEDRKLGLGDGIQQTDWQHSRSVHAKAFAIVCDFVEDTILQKKEVYMMKELNNIYLFFSLCIFSQVRNIPERIILISTIGLR